MNDRAGPMQAGIVGELSVLELAQIWAWLAAARPPGDEVAWGAAPRKIPFHGIIIPW